MKITYLVPQFQNIGDKVILIGAKSHYEKIYGKCEHELKFQSLPPTEPFETDIFVVCGTPWIWDLCTKSSKYNCLIKYLQMVKCKRKEALGLGSCYHRKSLDRKWIAFQHLSVCDNLAEIWKQFDYVSVRDHYAEYILKGLGVECFLTKCPAYNAVDYLEVKPKNGLYNALAIHDLTKGIGGEIMPLTYAATWKEILKKIIKKYEIEKLMIFHESEMKIAEDLDIKPDMFMEQDVKGGCHEKVRSLFRFLAEAKTVVSSRVHVSVPAICLGKPTFYIPIDTRSLTIQGATSIYDDSPELEMLPL